MHTKTMEGLIGARTNMNMTKVPMRVFKEARRKGDLDTMERAMGYVHDFEDNALQYKAEADEGMKEDAKEAKEKEKQAREQTIEKRREERKELETQREQQRIENTENSTVPSTEQTCLTDLLNEENTILLKTDTVEISSEGYSLLRQTPIDTAAGLPNDPVLYTSSGAADRSVSNNAATINVSV